MKVFSLIKHKASYSEEFISILFEEYYTSLVLFGNSYVEDIELAKDLVQDVFIKMIETGERFNNIDNYKAYLYSSVRNSCLKQIRHQGVKRKYEEEMKKQDNVFYVEHMLEEEISEILLKEIDKLPKRSSQVLKLAMDNKSNKEIAEILNITVETVKSHKQAGKRILQKKLGNLFIYTVLFYNLFN